MSSPGRAVATYAMPAVWCIPVVGMLEWLNLDQSSVLWVEWTTTADVVNGIYILLLPIAGGVACTSAAKLSRHREMVDGIASGSDRVLAGLVMSNAVVVSLAHVVTMGVVAVVGWAQGMDGGPPLLTLVPVLSAVLLGCSIGAVIGLWTRTLVAAPLVVLVLYVAQIFQHRTGNALFVDFGGATTLLLGARHRTDVVLLQSLWLLSAAAVVLLLPSLIDSRRRRRTVTGAGIAVSVLAAYALGTRGESRFVEDETSWVCDQRAVRICVLESYADELPAYAPRVTRWAQALERTGVPAPDVYRQAAGLDTPRGGFFSVTDDAGDTNLVFQLLQSSYGCSPRWTSRQLTAADAVTHFVMHGRGAPYPGGPRVDTRSVEAYVAELAC